MGNEGYQFPILVTCLLILGLQIHNPFKRHPAACRCDGATSVGTLNAEASTTRLGGGANDPYQQSSAGTRGQSRGGSQQDAPPAVYRQAREPTAPPASQGGISTDALLKELDSIQAKAREQQDTLSSSGRMPPPSPLLDQVRDAESMSGTGMRPPAARPPAGSSGMSQGMMPPAAGPLQTPDAPMLRRRDDFGRFLEMRQPQGLGIVLGVGRGDFALRLLSDWASAQGVYLVDPYIHIWQGYEDSGNLRDGDHQLVYEDLRNRLVAFEGRYVLVRDFSYSFAQTYQTGTTAPGPPSFVYIDANHAEKAISRDLQLWWPLLAAGGVLAGSTYMDDSAGRVRVQSAVDRFAASQRLKVYLTHDDMPPSWFIFKA